MAEPVRTFISIKIPMTTEIEDVLENAGKIRNVRSTSKDQIHITLKFLGDTDQSKIPFLCNRLKTAFSSIKQFDLTVKGLGAFPNDKSPRIIWMGIEENDELDNVARIVSDTVSSMNMNNDDKGFSPHVTIGRVNGRANAASFIEKNKETIFCKFRCTNISFMKSVLTQNGAKHTTIASIDLKSD